MNIDTTKAINAIIRAGTNPQPSFRALGRAMDKLNQSVSVPVRLIDLSALPASFSSDGHISVRA